MTDHLVVEPQSNYDAINKGVSFGPRLYHGIAIIIGRANRHKDE